MDVIILGKPIYWLHFYYVKILTYIILIQMMVETVSLPVSSSLLFCSFSKVLKDGIVTRFQYVHLTSGALEGVSQR